MLLNRQEIKQFKELITKGLINVKTIDLETSPSKFYGWMTGEQYVNYKNLVQKTETKIITAQWMDSLSGHPEYIKWQFDKSSMLGDDSRVVRKIVEVINEADIIIGQNIRSFDLKVLQNRARQLRLPAVDVDFNFDTTVHSRASFRQMSHSLDYRSQQYGLGGKIKMEMEDWIDILEGRRTPEHKMVPYGLKDICDGDALFWLDLPYYNIPKTLVMKVRRLIAQHTFVNRCEHCEKMKEKKFDFDVLSKKDGTFICNRCESTWKVKKELLSLAT